MQYHHYKYSLFFSSTCFNYDFVKIRRICVLKNNKALSSGYISSSDSNQLGFNVQRAFDKSKNLPTYRLASTVGDINGILWLMHLPTCLNAGKDIS